MEKLLEQIKELSKNEQRHLFVELAELAWSAKIKGTVFANANLKDADFQKAQLEDADLSNATIGTTIEEIPEEERGLK